ncbi:MAG: Na/Pi cotransporter family protein [Ruminococcaceae bacterium]|nr:Na/Pi cotransporter family protein [Oscillospiraceae bacterium]
MTSADIVSLLAGLAGGLAFFLYGMNVMSAGLEKMAGGKLETMMQKVTSNYWLSLLLGAGITIAVQSSSAMTVMLVGLVNSGIMTFGSTFGLIMGSNVGTTLTSWLLSLAGVDSGSNPILLLLKPIVFAPFLALIGAALRMFSKKEKHHDIGAILIGFTILIVGMDLMSNAVGIVEEKGGLEVFLTMFSNPILTLLISTVFTGIIQSSAATIGIVQALALSGAITYEMAIPLVLGANIGTCVTALIATLGTEKNAKRVAAIHTSVNVIGTIFFMIGLIVVNIVAPSFATTKATMFAVALIHTIFNMSIAVLLSPFKKPIVRLAELIVRDKKGEQKVRTVFLDERLLATPTLAVSECKRLAVEMGELTRTAIFSAIESVARYDAEKAAEVRELEGQIDRYEDKLGTYLVKLSGVDLTDADSHEVGRLLHSIGDFERISDHAVNIVDTAQEIHDKKIAFSDEARSELSRMTAAIVEIMDYTAEAFTKNDIETAAQVEPLEQVIDVMKSTYKERHITRLQEGRCTIELGFVFNDLITNYERVSDHCSNIAVSTIQRNAPKQDAHKYLRNLKNDENGVYAQMYSVCEKKYLENL